MNPRSRFIFLAFFGLILVDLFLGGFVFSSRVRGWITPLFERGPIAIPYEPTDLSLSVPVETIHSARPIDLDGDGKPEEIALVMFSHSGYGDPDVARLQIGSATTTVENALAERAVFEAHLGDHGERPAIALTLSVPNEQITKFFGYQEGKILSLGMVPGAFNELVFDAKQHIHTRQRGRLLDTWFREGEYALNASDGTLSEIQKPFYARHTEVRLKQNFAFVASPSSTRIAFRLKTGDRATITGCDEVAWCSLQTSGGKTGWFELIESYNYVMPINDPTRRIDPFDLFDGLSNAG